MSESYDIVGERDSPFMIMLFHSIGKLEGEEFHRLRRTYQESKKLEVCLTINGVEVSARAMIEHLVEIFDQSVHERALQMIEERVGADVWKRRLRIEELFTQMQEQLEDEAKRALGWVPSSD